MNLGCPIRSSGGFIGWTVAYLGPLRGCGRVAVGGFTHTVVDGASVAVHVLVRAPVAVPVARVAVRIPRIATVVVAARVPPPAVIATPVVPPGVAGSVAVAVIVAGHAVPAPLRCSKTV